MAPEDSGRARCQCRCQPFPKGETVRKLCSPSERALRETFECSLLVCELGLTREMAAALKCSWNPLTSPSPEATFQTGSLLALASQSPRGGPWAHCVCTTTLQMGWSASISSRDAEINATRPYRVQSSCQGSSGPCSKCGMRSRSDSIQQQ